MRPADRNGPEHIHVLVHEHDLLRRLYDLDRKEPDQVQARQAGGQTQGGWVIDAALVERPILLGLLP